uniref:G2/mitotic-specific cyclin-B3 n=31 Tax=Passeriformes TaxID=9126 RepID=A0A674HSD3_TAEGU
MACSQRPRERVPLPRNAKMLTTKQPRAGKAGPATENVDPEKEESSHAKRSSSSPQGGPKKRSAFGDLTNARKNQVVAGKKEAVKAAPPKAQKAHNALGVAKNNEINLKKSMKKTPPTAPAEPRVDPVPEKPVSVQELKPPEQRVGTLGCSTAPVPSQHRSVAATGGARAPGSALGLSQGDGKLGRGAKCTTIFLQESSPGQGLHGDEGREEKGGAEKQQPCPKKVTGTPRASPLLLPPPCLQVPAVEDIDKEQLGDPYANAEYAKEIFEYMREREEKFLLPDYMEKQTDISGDMRAILVDWMVEVQENFELNHETLYLAVKLVDHYLVEVVSMREKLQLIGSTAILIASKFEERCPPCVDDFLYICDDAYKREELIAMEMSILSTLKFDINIPIPYRFLRRFAKCARATMETLTLARFLCEMTLQEYDYARESPSKLAASCLLLALTMKNLGGWTPTLEYYSGYSAQDLHPLVKRLNFLLTYQPRDKLNAVRSKYSHRVFFEVAKVTPMDMLKLEETLTSS